MSVARFSCRCGAVRGQVSGVAPHKVNRVVCYCADCQAYAHQLGRADLLDAKGGSDIVQIAPAAMSITSGAPNVAGLRLSEKGLPRFYAKCCGTPLGNAPGAAIPFVGVLAPIFRCEGQEPDALFGKVTGGIKGEYAIGGAPPGTKGISLPLMLRAVGLVLGWKLAGRGRPHPFFGPDKQPLYPMSVLSKEQRDKLRPLCGPKSASSSL